MPTTAEQNRKKRENKKIRRDTLLQQQKSGNPLQIMVFSVFRERSLMILASQMVVLLSRQDSCGLIICWQRLHGASTCLEHHLSTTSGSERNTHQDQSRRNGFTMVETCRARRNSTRQVRGWLLEFDKAGPWMAFRCIQNVFERIQNVIYFFETAGPI